MHLKKTFLRYAVVGLSGTAVDFVVLIFLVETAGLIPTLAGIPAFILAVLNNYYWNNRWTYNNPAKRHREKMTKFFLVSLVGLAINILLFHFFSLFAIWYIFTKIFIIGVVLCWNFGANTFWTFSVKSESLGG